jgi:hypothetical protein
MFNKFAFFHLKYDLHKMAEQEEDMKRKRNLLTVKREAGYC